MKKRIFCLSLIMLCSICVALAQRPRVYIPPFKYSGKDLRNLLPQFRSAVMSGIGSSNRLEVIEYLGSSEMSPAEIYEAALAAQADYILQCELFNHNLTDAVNLIASLASAVENKPGYIYDNLSYKVQLTRVSDRVVVNSSKLSNASGASTGRYTSAYAMDAATYNVMSWAGQQMRRYIEAYFPLEARIVEAVDVKQGKVQTLYINLGTYSQVNPKTKFIVYELKKVGNDQVREQIGELRVEKVNGDNLSLCKVKKGAKEIYDAMQSGKELLVISTVKL